LQPGNMNARIINIRPVFFMTVISSEIVR